MYFRKISRFCLQKKLNGDIFDNTLKTLLTLISKWKPLRRIFNMIIIALILIYSGGQKNAPQNVLLFMCKINRI